MQPGPHCDDKINVASRSAGCSGQPARARRKGIQCQWIRLHSCFFPCSMAHGTCAAARFEFNTLDEMSMKGMFKMNITRRGYHFIASHLEVTDVYAIAGLIVASLLCVLSA